MTIVDKVKQAANLFELVPDSGLDDRTMILKNAKSKFNCVFLFQGTNWTDWVSGPTTRSSFDGGFRLRHWQLLAVVGAGFHPVPFAWIGLVGESLRILRDH